MMWNDLILQFFSLRKETFSVNKNSLCLGTTLLRCLKTETSRERALPPTTSLVSSEDVRGERPDT